MKGWRRCQSSAVCAQPLLLNVMTFHLRSLTLLDSQSREYVRLPVCRTELCKWSLHSEMWVGLSGSMKTRASFSSSLACEKNTHACRRFAVDACCSMINSICIILVSSSVCTTVAGPLHCQLAFVSPSPRNSPVKSYVNVTYPHWRAHWHTHHNTSADHRFQATFISCFRAVILHIFDTEIHLATGTTTARAFFSFFFSIQKKIHKRKQLKM